MYRLFFLYSFGHSINSLFKKNVRLVEILCLKTKAKNCPSSGTIRNPDSIFFISLPNMNQFGFTTPARWHY